MKPSGFMIIVVLLAALPAAVAASVPATLTYQGLLTDANGTPVPDGNYTLVFRLYEVGQGGAPVWSETHLLPVVGGAFSTVLGDVASLSLPFDREYFLGVSVDGGAEMAPRRRLTASAYSLNARSVDKGAAVTRLNGLAGDVSLVGGGSVAVTQSGNTLTITSAGGGGGPVTLDGAYDEGGAGAGRVITADAGPVHVQGPDGIVVDGRIGVGVAAAQVPVDAVTADPYAVYGETSTTAESGAGVFGGLNNANAAGGASGVIGVALDQSALTNGVWGDHATIGIGVFGTVPDGFAVAGLAYGTTVENVGVYGESKAAGLGWAGYFFGDVGVVGQVYTGATAMLIDHPTAPREKLLYHAAVHSPEMTNVYTGTAMVGPDGRAAVVLPDYFESLNADVRYQLTSIGAPAPNLYVASEVADNRFEIAGGVPGAKVSWTVTGVRRDAASLAMDRRVVRDKPRGRAGHYRFPEAYGAKRVDSAFHAVHPTLRRNLRRGLAAAARRPVASR